MGLKLQKAGNRPIIEIIKLFFFNNNVLYTVNGFNRTAVGFLRYGFILKAVVGNAVVIHVSLTEVSACCCEQA